MAKNIALLEFSIMFDPTETWAHMYEFENMFGKFLEAQGLRGEVMMPIGQGTRRVIFISKDPDVEPLVPAPAEEQKGPQKKMKEMQKGIK